MPEIRTVSVVGAGTMGTRIAFKIAFGGDHRVVLTDTSPPQLAQAAEKAPWVAGRLVDGGYRTGEQARCGLRNLAVTSELPEAVGRADLVIEAITEDLAAKRTTWKELDRCSTPAAVLATNSSMFSISELTPGPAAAERSCGMHFSHPMTMLALCEVVRGPATSNQVIESVTAFLRAIDCIPVVLNKERFAHICNRWLLTMVDEALRIVGDGYASPADVDAAFKIGLGFPYGPFEMMRETGLANVQALFREAIRNHVIETEPDLLTRLAWDGETGRRDGHPLRRPATADINAAAHINAAEETRK